MHCQLLLQKELWLGLGCDWLWREWWREGIGWGVVPPLLFPNGEPLWSKVEIC